MRFSPTGFSRRLRAAKTLGVIIAGGEGTSQNCLLEIRFYIKLVDFFDFSYILSIYILFFGGNMQKAKLFMNGQSQAVRLPKEFRFNGKEVFIKRVGNVVVLIPQDKAWDSFFEGINSFSEDCFEGIREQPPVEIREEIE